MNNRMSAIGITAIEDGERSYYESSGIKRKS